MKRRHILGAIAAAGAALTAGLYRFTDLFVKHYAPTPYDDVLAHLVDRAQAARLGAAVQNAPQAPQLAARLRASLQKDAAAAAEADVAAGRLMEVDGWLLPQTIVLLSALAAKV